MVSINTSNGFIFPDPSNNQVRIGISFGGTLSLIKSTQFAKLAEKKGFESIWVPEHYGIGREPLITLAAFTASTKHIKLATGVVGSYTRHPAILAFTLGTLDEFSNGRLILGLGTGNLQRMEDRLRIKRDKPVTHLTNTLMIVKKLISGESISYNGKIFQISNLNLGFTPTRTKIPIYIGAIKEKMLRMAVNIADGIIFSAASPPGYIKYALKIINEEAKIIGRDINNLDIACNIICSVLDDSDKARESVKPNIMSFLSRSKRGEYIMKMEGLDAKLLVIIRKALERGDRKKALSLINDDIIDSLSIAGSPKDCTKRLKHLRDIGIKLPILGPQENNYRETINVFKTA